MAGIQELTAVIEGGNIITESTKVLIDYGSNSNPSLGLRMVCKTPCRSEWRTRP